MPRPYALNYENVRISSMNSQAILEFLANGEMAVEGQFMWGSNYTYLTHLTHNGGTLKAVYKPVRGEQPLWDFPSDTLAGREVAAYLVSEAIGWNFVPPTIFRRDGPAGPGSLQFFVEHDPERHYFNFTPEERQRLRPVALFDVVVNNTDRKGGHILIGEDGKFWLIDHGICFHSDPKLRTVIWDFAGEPLPEDGCRQLTQFLAQLVPGGALTESLFAHLTEMEIEAMRWRTEKLLASGIFPRPHDRRYSYPWPPV